MKDYEQFILISTEPYVKKQNLIGDKASWHCWQVHVRKSTNNSEEFSVIAGKSLLITFSVDVFLTILRRKYIPPLMETFQDIIVISSCVQPVNSTMD